jgi:hypothetical protein
VSGSSFESDEKRALAGIVKVADQLKRAVARLHAIRLRDLAATHGSSRGEQA